VLLVAAVIQLQLVPAEIKLVLAVSLKRILALCIFGLLCNE
jgi:hypothetical protein